MFRIFAFWTWTSGEAAEPLPTAATAGMMMHAKRWRSR